MEHKKWEYDIRTLGGSLNIIECETFLNEKGTDGWELVNCHEVSHETHDKVLVFIFKRAIINKVEQ